MHKQTEISTPLKPIKDLLGKQYYIPNYQRGYRWGEEQVTKLLDDIWEFSQQEPRDTFYCLQPLIIKESGEKLEVLDGQQRLTTLNLIVHYFNQHFKGSTKYPEMEREMELHYQTRPESSEIFASIYTDEEGEVQMQDVKHSIDFWHIREAYGYIHKWFSSQRDKQGGFDDEKFQSVFLDEVKVIWYEIEANEDPIKVFTRNNIGKIPLEDIELIKALLLKGSKLKESEDSTSNQLRQQLEIARAWDEMEQSLHDPKLWAFIVGNKANEESISKLPVRLERIFAIVLGLEESKEKSSAFNRIEEKLQQNEQYLGELWNEVLRLYRQILDWYSGHKTYHYIAYLTHTGTSVQRICNLAKESQTKEEFITKLRDEVKGKVSKLRYNSDEGFYLPQKGEDEHSKELYGKRELLPLLLLYNVSLCLREGSYERFPFELLQGKEKWDIEHIDSQTANSLSSKTEQTLWLKTTLAALNEKVGEPLRSEIDDYIKTEDESEDFEQLREKLQELAGEEDDEYSQSIGNLALLEASINRSYGNALFIIKRNTLQEREQDGKFIPPGTKIAFMKYFSTSNLGLDKWGTEDKRAYEKHIYDSVEDYIKNE